MAPALNAVKLALRSLRRAPTYAITTWATFAMATGAVAAVYSAAQGLLLDPLPFTEPDRLVFIGEASIEPEPVAHVTSRYVLERVAAEVPALESVAVYNIWEATLTGVGDPARLSGAVVTASYFEVLGYSAVRGRTFRPEDDTPGAPLRVVISHRLWTSRFGADPGVVGRIVELTGADYEIVGVLPAGFESPDEYTFTSARRPAPDVWRTFRSEYQRNPNGRSYRGVARLTSAGSLARARTQVDALGHRIGEEFPDWGESSRIRVLPMRDQFTARARPTLLLLLAGVAFVLIAACVNVMGLTLARGLDRAGDLRVRGALGASRPTLVREIVTETLLVGGLGGLAGLGLAALGVSAFLAAAPPEIPRIDNIRLDTATVPVVIAITLAVAVVAGVVPSVRLLWGRGSPAGAWAGRGQTQSRVRRRTLAAFSVAQVALAVMLLTGAGLLLRSFIGLVSVDPGYDPSGVAVAQLDLPDSRYPEPADRRRALVEILRRFREDAGVVEAGLVTSVPQHGLNNFSFGLGIVGLPGDSTARAGARYRGVSDGYAETMGLSVLRGRMIGRQDWSESAEGELHVTGVAVNEEFVRRWLPPGTPAVGTTLDLGGMLSTRQVPIVGVLASVKYGSPADPDEPELYVPVTGRFWTVFVAVKARGDSGPVATRMKSVVQAVDPLLPMDEVFAQERLLANATSQARTTLALMVGLASFAVLLGAMGLYGVIAHGVARRAREFGIRMAIGAAGRAVVSEILRQGARLTVLGAALGLLAAGLGARTLQALLYGVEARDPVAFAGAALVVLAVSLIATWVPARRATRVDPVEVLRGE